MPKARPVDSRQLRLMLDALSDGRPHSAWDLCICARTSDPTTILRELRQHGYEIPKRYEGPHIRYQLTTADLERLIAQQRADLDARAAALAAASPPSPQRGEGPGGEGRIYDSPRSPTQ